MSDTSDQTPAAPEAAPDGDSLALKRKKKDKVRTAWIGFFGRILAQILGAVASVILGLYVLQNYQKGRDESPAPSASPAERPAARSAAPRDPKRMALAFEQAIQRDPNFALAYAGLADAYSLDVGQGREAKAKEAAQKALSLDERLGEAHTSLAAVLHPSEGRVDEADREFRRALELNPGHATSHQWYAILLSEEGRDAEATERAQHAVSLDPLSGAMHQTLSLVHYNWHRYEAAAAAVRRAIDLAPQLSLARSILARALTAMGSASAAIQVCELDPSPNPEVRLALGVAYLKAGDRQRADAIVHELEGARPEPTAALARWYATIGDRARTLDMLKKSVGAGTTLQGMRRDPVFDAYRSDAAFASLLQRQPS